MGGGVPPDPPSFLPARAPFWLIFTSVTLRRRTPALRRYPRRALQNYDFFFKLQKKSAQNVHFWALFFLVAAGGRLLSVFLLVFCGFIMHHTFVNFAVFGGNVKARAIFPGVVVMAMNVGAVFENQVRDQLQ